MKSIKLLLLSTLFLLANACNNQHYITVIPVDEITSPSKNQGFFYILPQTALNIDVTVVKKEFTPGPFADYAKEYLSIENAGKIPYTKYYIAKVSVESYAEPDYDKQYFIVYDKEKLPEKLYLEYSEKGFLKSVNSLGDKAWDKKEKEEYRRALGYFGQQESFYYFLESGLKERVDTIYEFVELDTITVQRSRLISRMKLKSSETRASEVADYILNLRDKKLALITGFSEIPYSKESIEYMYEGMSRLEQNYLALFTGLSSESIIRYNYNYVPSANLAGSELLFLFSENDGIISYNDSIYKGIDSVYISIEPRAIPQKLHNPYDAVDGGFFYRTPEPGAVKIKKGDTVIFETIKNIQQLGRVRQLPAGNFRIRFYDNSGAIKSIEALTD